MSLYFLSPCDACSCDYSAAIKRFVQNNSTISTMASSFLHDLIQNLPFITILFFSINQITTVKYYSCTVPWIIPTLNVAGHGCSAVSFYYIIFYILDNILWLCPMQIWELTRICQIMYVSTCMHEIVKFTFENKCINNLLYCGEWCELFMILNSCLPYNTWCLVR